MAQTVKNLPPMQETQETWVQSLGREDLPGEENGYPLQYSCPENSMDRETWWATEDYSPWGHKELDMAE